MSSRLQQQLQKQEKCHRVTTAMMPPAASSWIPIRVYLSRRSWVPLDSASLSPEKANELGVPLLGRLLVDLAGLRLVFLAVPEVGVRGNHLLLPPWVSFLLDKADGTTANVTIAPQDVQSPQVTSVADQELVQSEQVVGQLASLCLEVEGPVVGPGEAASLAFLLLARPSLRKALMRQLTRAGTRLVAGACFAARISGHVCAFRVLRCYALDGSPVDLGGAPREFKDIRIQQDLPMPQEIEHEDGQTGATICLEALREAAALSANDSPHRARLLCEGAPPASAMCAFLRCIHDALNSKEPGVRVAHLPLNELLWELPRGGPNDQTFRQLLDGFTENAVLSGCSATSTSAQTVTSSIVVLWGLDGPLPPGGAKWLLAGRALSPLQSLPRHCGILGLCRTSSSVPSALRSFFAELGVPPGPCPCLGLAGRSNTSVLDKEAQVPPSELCKPPAPTVVGATEVLEQLSSSVIGYYRCPEAYKAMGFTWPPRLLLQGPSGAGKTHLLRWLCSQLPQGVSIAWLHPGDVWSKYLGESEQRLRRAFANASQSAAGLGSVLLLEGVDQLVPGRKVGESMEEVEGFRHRLAATLLVCLDGIDNPAHGQSGAGPGLGVVATTCTWAEDMDARITRPGRMDRWVSLLPPDANSRLGLLRHFADEIGASNRPKESVETDGTVYLGMTDGPDEATRHALITWSAGWLPGRLQLAAAGAWATLLPGQQTPSWQDVLASVQRAGGLAGSGRLSAAGSGTSWWEACKEEIVASRPADATAFRSHASREQPAATGHMPELLGPPGDAVRQKLEEAAALAVPSSDDEW
mmetsp:Transcript_70874/g.136712  ORF Transcript_70874/g.136712 Transcript_70874/m.136712 type:complete len:810 (+) Transcript_70874:315-2744(+)